MKARYEADALVVEEDLGDKRSITYRYRVLTEGDREMLEVTLTRGATCERPGADRRARVVPVTAAPRGSGARGGRQSSGFTTAWSERRR